MMTDLKICRICLNTEVKMYNYDRYYLKQYYEEIMTAKVNGKDSLPQQFCYECATMLRKYHKFKEKCFTGQKLLQELLWKGSITLKSINNIDKISYNLKSSLDLILKNKRVRTYLVKSETITENSAQEQEPIVLKDNTEEIEGIKIEENEESEGEQIDGTEVEKLPNIDVIELNYKSDDSLDSKNLAEIKKETVIKENLINHDELINDWTISNHKESNDINDNKNNDDRISDDESNIENMVVNDIVNAEEDDIITLEVDTNSKSDSKVTGKNNKQNKQGKLKQFELKSKDNLDPKHWLKMTLSEEEAVEEFKARAKDPKYLRAAYKCTDCYKGFSKEDMLNRHTKLFHTESRGPAVCRFCNMRFKWKCLLPRHVTQHYTKYKCLRCDLIFAHESTMVIHNKFHNGVTKKCAHCGEEFSHMTTYYTHLRMNHRSEHVCTLCGASFVSAHGLGIHKRTMHINTIISPVEASAYCERCDVKFETRKAYELHVFHSAKHTEAGEDSTNEIAAQSKLLFRKREFKRTPRKFTTCNVCNKSFSTHTAYAKHHAVEHKNEPFPTKVGERVICEICGASLAYASMAGHLNRHTRERLFTCQACGTQFSSKGSLMRHQLTHTGEKPVECSLCEKRFTQRSHMQLHYRTVHLKQSYPKRIKKKKIPMTEDIQTGDSDDL